MKQLSMFEESLVDCCKKIVSVETSVKNLKKQYKELLATYIGSPNAETAKSIVDILVNIQDMKDDLKTIKGEINNNVEELVKDNTNVS